MPGGESSGDEGRCVRGSRREREEEEEIIKGEGEGER